jgi:hypothetical protein
MARLTRAVGPGIPHHGNMRQQTFFIDEDYQSYLELMSKCKKYGVRLLSYAKPRSLNSCPPRIKQDQTGQNRTEQNKRWFNSVDW